MKYDVRIEEKVLKGRSVMYQKRVVDVLERRISLRLSKKGANASCVKRNSVAKNGYDIF